MVDRQPCAQRCGVCDDQLIQLGTCHDGRLTDAPRPLRDGHAAIPARVVSGCSGGTIGSYRVQASVRKFHSASPRTASVNACTTWSRSSGRRHEDRTPSLSLQLQREVWHCHSCGKGGDAYQLIMGRRGVPLSAPELCGLSRPRNGRRWKRPPAAIRQPLRRRRPVSTRPRNQPGNSANVLAWRRL
ncbi:CHC2 zinc finger domain-containing protein [Actinoplanes sp. NPDC051859]|uniref:CHC2 zinc finger domain-containing protein n=1 Tax=Actinoplanes sp. NPDC051859 TaxID=3363909 RepID=UPI0037B3AD8A